MKSPTLHKYGELMAVTSITQSGPGYRGEEALWEETRDKLDHQIGPAPGERAATECQ
jgi:hypothetical protein